MTLWAVSNADASYRAWLRPTHQALHQASFELHPGERLGIAGPSGGGKSTLVRCGLGLMPIDRGSVHWFGEDTKDWSKPNWRTLRAQVQWLPQDSMALLHPRMPLWALLESSAQLHRPKESSKTVVERALEEVGLGHRAQALPHTLSGGEKRRAAIARIRIAKPRVVVADEPTAGLDAERKEGVLQALLGDPETAVVIVSHDIPALASVCHRLLLVADGTVLESLPADRLRNGTARPVSSRTQQLLTDAGWRALRGTTT